MRRAVLSVIIALFSLTLVAEGQTRCSRCKNQGWTACKGKEHVQKLTCGTKLEHRCDMLYRALCCRGTKRVACAKCNDEITALQLDEEFETRRQWTKKIALVDGAVGTRFVHVESKHFLLHFSIASWKEKNKKRDRVKAAHLFAERLEETLERFQKLTGATVKQRQVVYMSGNLIHHQKTTKYLMGSEQKLTWIREGPSCELAIWPDPRFTRKGKDFHATVVYNTTEILTRSAGRFQSSLAPWFRVGFAHWVERDQFKNSRTFANANPEKPDENPWIDGLWHRKIRRLAQKREAPTLQTLLDSTTKDLMFTEQVVAWSYVDYMLTGPHKDRFKAFFRALKKNNKSREALQEVYGMTPEAFENAWRAYVMRTY